MCPPPSFNSHCHVWRMFSLRLVVKVGSYVLWTPWQYSIVPQLPLFLRKSQLSVSLILLWVCLVIFDYQTLYIKRRRYKLQCWMRLRSSRIYRCFVQAVKLGALAIPDDLSRKLRRFRTGLWLSEGWSISGLLLFSMCTESLMPPTLTP